VAVLLPEEIESRFTPEDIRLHLALGMYLDRRVTLGQAATIAGVSQADFMHELGRRRIPVHYEIDDALADVAAAEQWGR
jgi:predicted HTH domain antitoxin